MEFDDLIEKLEEIAVKPEDKFSHRLYIREAAKRLKALAPEGGASLDEKRWATLVFLHPMDVATAVMGAKTGTEMQAGMERLADAFLAKALKGV